MTTVELWWTAKRANITSVLLMNAFGDSNGGFFFALLVNLEYQFQMPAVTGGVSGGEGAGDILAVELESSEENRRNIVTESSPSSYMAHYFSLRSCE
ncbi:hypothetical protein BDFB_000295 [Asbolus verrucosus]|uniref:Uncharacterized protein n=1 Tax=Asbolus verrucosus TaxID=1661398 RepID=A0A482V6H0_ASBVE|nr:hypothetical protein BDFB_000295 [Asbolus verrucosus]